MAYHQLRIAKIVQETPDARSFVLEVPANLAAQFKYRAGQFLTFKVPHEQGTFNRCYSLSSAPEIDTAYVYSGRDGRVLLTLHGEAKGDRFGEHVSSVGDFERGGHADLIIGAPGNNAGGQGAGRAYVQLDDLKALGLAPLAPAVSIFAQYRT